MDKNIKTAVALGNFDGVHLGHRAVLNAVSEKKRDGFFPLAAVFDVHPRSFMSETPLRLLCTAEERTGYIKNIGLDVYVMNFQETRDLSPYEFFERILKKELNARFIACGEDYRFGKNAAGDFVLLKSLCIEHGIELISVAEQKLNGERISSTNIKNALAVGDIRKANAMLGREYSYNFTVVCGDRRGRSLGVPTINQFFPASHIIPCCGVYTSRVFAEGQWHKSVTNIGSRPTIGGDVIRSETHILDFNNDLYNQNVEVCLIDYLREEINFNSLDELKEQLQKDVEQVRSIKYDL